MSATNATIESAPRPTTTSSAPREGLSSPAEPELLKSPTAKPTDKPSVAPAPAHAPPPHYREDLIHPDPLLDCLVEACRLHGVAASRASLSAGLPLAHGRLGPELVERAAARAGMAARLQRIPLERIDGAALPVILILKDDQACVLLGWEHDGQSVRVLLPESGQGSVTWKREDLAQRYAAVALFVRPRLRFDARSQEGDRVARTGHWF